MSFDKILGEFHPRRLIYWKAFHQKKLVFLHLNFQSVDRAVMFVVLGQAFETSLIQILLVLEMAECITLIRILGFSRCKGMEEE